MLKMHGTTARQKYNLISKSDDKLLQYVTKGEWGGECRVHFKLAMQLRLHDIAMFFFKSIN